MSKFDGCNVLVTDLAPQSASKETVHQRYKDLAEVEQIFRSSKTVNLEMRPVHVRNEISTRAHVMVERKEEFIFQGIWHRAPARLDSATPRFRR
ncbi:MAG: hypothetical protein PHV34_08315 [Verrucomicrobiae bacterium]|nr:hypothetical protein [Verrucomicrobiae bacterium]